MQLHIQYTHTSIFLRTWRQGLLPKKLYVSVAGPPALARVPIQRPLAPSVTYGALCLVLTLGDRHGLLN